MNKLTHITQLLMNSGSILKKSPEFGGVFTRPIRHMLNQNASTFEINGHEASLLHYYDEHHIVRAN